MDTIVIEREKVIQKIAELLDNNYVGSQAPDICVAALNKWAEHQSPKIIYLLQAVPPVDRGRLYGM